MAAVTICSDFLVLYNFWWLYGGVNGDLLQEGLCHTQLCCTQSPLPLQQATADPYLHRRHSDTVLAQPLWNLWVLVCPRFVWALQASLVGMGFDSKSDFAPPTILLLVGVSPLSFDVECLFLVGSNILLLMVVQQLVVIFEFSQEKMSTCPIPPSWKLSIGNYGPIDIYLHSLEIKNFPILIFSYFSLSASLTTFFLSFFFFQLYQNTLHTDCRPHIMLYTEKAKINVKCMHAQSCLTLGDSIDCSHQAPLSMGIPRQVYWSGLPFPTPGDRPNPGIKIVLPASASLAGRFFTTSTTWEPPTVKIFTIKEFIDKTMKQRVEREFKKVK